VKNVLDLEFDLEQLKVSLRKSHFPCPVVLHCSFSSAFLL